MSSWIDNPAELLSVTWSLRSLNSLVQCFLLLGIVWSVAVGSVIPICILILASLLATVIVTKNKKKSQAYVINPYQQQMSQRLHLSRNPHDYLNNPMPLGDYDRAVRSIAPQINVIQENMLGRLYREPGVLDVEMRINPLPDPTLMARHPTWWESSEIDRSIVQDTGNLRYIR